MGGFWGAWGPWAWGFRGFGGVWGLGLGVSRFGGLGAFGVWVSWGASSLLRLPKVGSQLKHYKLEPLSPLREGLCSGFSFVL